MPRTTPAIKVEGVRSRGAEVVLHGDTYDEACTHAYALVDARGLTFVHPYDDPDVIAGQGTIGMEILHQHKGTIDAVFVPVGGGGLLAGGGGGRGSEERQGGCSHGGESSRVRGGGSSAAG